MSDHYCCKRCGQLYDQCKCPPFVAVGNTVVESKDRLADHIAVVQQALFDLCRRDGLDLTWEDRLRIGQAIGMLANYSRTSKRASSSKL